MPIPLTAREPVLFTPPSLGAPKPPAGVDVTAEQLAAIKRPEFQVRVPTFFERDNFASTLMRGGIVDYGPDTINSLYRAGVQQLWPDRFDEINALLDQLDQAVAADRKARSQMLDLAVQIAEREREMPESERMTPEQIDEELRGITPDVHMEPADRARATAVRQEITAQYQPLQKALADMIAQDVRRNWLCIETYLHGWQGETVTFGEWTGSTLAFWGLEHYPTGNGRGGITRPEAEWLRNRIGSDAFEEVANLIFMMHGLSEDEEGNLPSLIASLSAPTGSPGADEKMSDPVGKSVDAPTTPTRAARSRRTVGTSSGSTRTSAKKTKPSGSSRTGKGSLTSR